MKREDKAPLDVSQETRDIIGIPYSDIEKLKNFLKDTKYSFYVLLLGRDNDNFIKEYVLKNWKNLHFMSGDKVLFLSVYQPEKIDSEIREDLNKKFGKILKDLDVINPSPAWIYKYIRYLNISVDKLPCLFIGTDLESDKGIIIKIPELDEKHLTEFFEFLFMEKLNKLADLDKEERLKKLKESVNQFFLKRLKLQSHEIYIEYVLPNVKKVLPELVILLIKVLEKKL